MKSPDSAIGMGSGTKNVPEKGSERKQSAKMEDKSLRKEANVPKKDKSVKPTPRGVDHQDVKLNEFSRAPTGYFIKGDEFVDVDRNIKPYDAPDIDENKKPDQETCEAQGKLLPKNEVIRFPTPKNDLEID